MHVVQVQPSYANGQDARLVVELLDEPFGCVHIGEPLVVLTQSAERFAQQQAELDLDLDLLTGRRGQIAQGFQRLLDPSDRLLVRGVLDCLQGRPPEIL